MTDIFADKLNAARSRIAASLLPKISSAVAASSASKLTATPMGNNLKEHIANGGQPTNDMINYFNDKTIADGVNRQNISDAQQNDYFGVSTANITSPNVFMAAAANAVNLAGGAVGTLAQWGNTLAGDEFTAQAIAMEAGTPAHVVDAYNALNRTREKKNQLAEQSRVIREQIRNKQGDPIQLNAQLLAIETAYKGIQVDPNVMNTLSVKSGDTTYLEKLDASQELRHKGARVTAGSGEGILPAMKSSDFSNPYYKKPLEQANKGDQFITDTNALADRQLDEGTLTGTLQGIGNKVLATGKSIGNVLAAGVNHPMGVLQYTAESAPYFALPGIGTIAIGNQTAVEGRSKFETRTGQALPTTGQNAAMLAADAVYMGLNYVGDSAVNSALRGATAAPVRSSSQVLLDAARGVGSTGLRAAGKEGLAEGAQTYLEESGQNLGTYFNPDTVGQAAAIGALSSGVVSTPADLKHGVKNYKINKFLNSPMGQEALAQVEKQKVLDAIPLAELQNPTSANHNPVEAINRMTTGVTEATKDTVIKDVSALVNNLQDVVTERETSLANAELRIAEATKMIPLIDQLIASGNTDPRLVEGRKNYVDYLEGDGSPQRIKEQQVAVESATSELINAHEHAKIKLKAVRDAFGVANPNTAPAVSVPTFNAPIPTQSSSARVTPYTQGAQGETFILDDTYNPIPVEVISDVTTEAIKDDLLGLSQDYVTIRYTDESGQVVEEKVTANSVRVNSSGTATQSNTPPTNPSTGGTVYPYPSKDAGVRAALESSDVTKNYTPEQREVLRVFSDAVVLIHSTKELKDVSIDIKQGGNTGGQKYRGLDQYMARVVEAINNGNVRSQQYYFRSLAKFSQSHTSKAQKFQEALDAYTPGMVKIVQKNDDTNLWEIMDTVTEDVFNAGNFKKDLRKTGGFGIRNNSAELVAKVQIEADGIAKVLEAIDVMVNGSQSVAPTPAVPAPVVAPTPPVVTEPSDTTPVDVTPAPEAPVQSGAMTPEVNQSLEDYIKSLGRTSTDKYKQDLLTTFNAEVDKSISNGYVGGLVGSTKEYNKDKHAVLVAIAASKGYTVGTPIVGNGVYTATLTKSTATPATPATPTETKAPVNVWAGSDENTGLSNLATRPFTFGTKKYQSVEHAYQTLKSGSFDQQTYDKYAGTENKKIAGNRGTKTTDNANVRLMEKLMTASFEQNRDAMELLQKTGNTVITHTQDKSIWGKEFPRILMEIRESNKTPEPSQDTTVVTPTPEAPVQSVAVRKARAALNRLKTVYRSDISENLSVDAVTTTQISQWKDLTTAKGKTKPQRQTDAIRADIAIVEQYVQTKPKDTKVTVGFTPTPIAERSQGHKAAVVVADGKGGGKYIYEGTNADVTYHYLWDTFNDNLVVLRIASNGKTGASVSTVDPLTGKIEGTLTVASTHITPEQVIAGMKGMVVVGDYVQATSTLSEKQRASSTKKYITEALNGQISLTKDKAEATRLRELRNTLTGVKPRVRSAKSKTVFPDRHSLLDAIKILGGVSRTEAKKLFGLIDTSDIAIGVLTNGERTLSFEQMAEALSQDGYPVFENDNSTGEGNVKKVSGEALYDSLERALNGEDIGTDTYMIAKAEAQRNADLQVEQDAEIEAVKAKATEPKKEIIKAPTQVQEPTVKVEPSKDTTTAPEPVKQAPVESKAQPKDKTTFPVSEESKTIYGKLGNKTVSGNVVINKVYQLAGVAYAESIGAIFSLRVDKNSKGEKNHKHFGNPFSSVTGEIAKGLVPTKSTKESVQRYIDWVLAENTVYNPEQHAWIREQLKSGNLKGKRIVYYKELGEPSHATALDYLINKYDWGTKPADTTIPVTPKDSTEVVVVPETVVPVTPPDSETGDVEIQEDVSSFPEVAEPKEETTPAGGLSILAGTGSVKDRMKAEQEKAANNSKGIGSVVPIDTTKADEKTVKAWFAEASEKANKVITTGIQRANLVIASFYQKAKAPSKLVQVKDFAKTVLAMSPTEQAQMLSDALGETATDSQVQFLESFLMFDKSLRGTMDIMAVPTGKNNFRFKDYLQYLFTDVKTFKQPINPNGTVMRDVVTGTLDENIKTAISVGIHTFLIEKTSQFSLDHEGVAELLGFSNTKSVPYEVHRMFENVGNVQPNVVKYLGTKAYQALQLSMDPNVPAQRKESLINALGSLAVQTMLAEGLLQYTRIPNDIIKDAKAAIEGGVNTAERNENIYTVYLRPAYDTKQVTKNGWTYESEPKPIARIEALKMSAKGNTKVMSKLFSVDGRDILPMLKKPTKFTQDTLSKTGNEVPDATADLVLQMMQKAYNVNGYTYSAMKTLFETDPDALYAMVGVVSEEDVAKQHISIRGATESKNEALKRSVVNGLDFIDSLTTDEDGNFPDYYLPMSVWSVNRVGVTSNLFNEQGDKVHRALTTMTAHKQQVTISPAVDSDNKLTQYGRFLTGVAAYMEGIKINGKTVDKTDGVSFLPGFQAYISSERFQEVLESVGALVLGTATAEDIERVQIEVIKLEGGAMSLTSLIALYEASQAKEVEVEIDGVKTKVSQFTTSMSTGSDGVTNGMALSLLMYDAASLSEDFVAAMTWKEKDAFNKASPKAKEAILQAKKDAFDLANPKDTKGMTKAEKDAFNAGGIFFEGDSVDSMVKFRKSGKADLYEQLAKVQKDLLQKYVQDNKGNTVLLSFIAAMNNIDPTFGTRAGAKVSLVPFVYGSGFRSIGAAQSRAFMEQFYKALTKAMLSGDAAKIKQFQANYVALAQGVRIPVAHDFTKMSVKDALDTELSLRDVKAITGVENKIRKAITKDALSQVAGTLIQARSRVSGLANVGFESYNRIYTALQEMAHAKLKAANALPYRYASSGKVAGETVAVEGMNVKQNQAIDDELKDFTPQIISVGGVHSVNGVQSAHSMWEESQIRDTSSTGEVSSEFGDIAEGVATPNNMVKSKASKSITTSLHTRSVESRGAATNAAVVQAMDAWITAKVSAAMDTFNHHDENVSSIDKAAEMGQLQNKTLFNAVLDYDVYLEVLNGSLLRPLRGIIKLSKRDDTLAIAKGEVGKVMADLKQYMDANFGGFNEDMGMLASLVHEMYALEIAKLIKYQNLKSISQYGIEGGEYTVTKKDVARINDLFASHVASRTALLKEVAKMSADLKAIGAKPKAEPEVKAETKEETPKGKPASVDSFIVRNEEGVVDTLATLNSMSINDSTLVGKVIKQVVEALKGKLPANLKVHMLAGDVLPAALNNDKVKYSLSRNAPGITYSTGNTHTIGLVEGKADRVTFIHELMHASTVSGLSGTSAKARKLKFNISKLRSEALSAYRKYTDSLDPVLKVDAERRDKVYMDAFNSEGDKDAEFVAMAMSEPAIIAFLATVPAPKTTNTGTLMSVFSAFIKSVGEFLGMVKNAQGKDVESVLEAMVRQTAHLMNINDQSSASEQINNYPGQQAAVDAVRLIREYPSKEVFNVLPASLDVGFDTYLSSLMDTIVDKTFNHLSFPATTYTPLEVWKNAITDGRTPYTTRAVAAGFILSERELFAIETLEVALKGAMDAGITTPVYKEMERAYESARKTLKPESFYNGDWSTALESDREIARNKYKHLFKMEGGQATRSDYMSRFMAMALASSEVNSLLGFPTLTEARVDGTIFSKILAYYEYAMDWVSGHLTGTMRYQTINSKLPTLAQKLVDIDHKKRDQALSSVYDTVSDNLNKADKYLKESGNTLADKLENMIGDSKKGLPSAARTASRVVLRGAAMDMLKVSKIWRDMSAPNTVLGWKGELLNELSDPSSVGQAVRSLLRIHTRLQTERKTHKSTTKESILSNFLNGGKNLSKDDHSAITYGVLRGDLKALYDLHGIRGIEKLLNNADEVDAEVARLEGLITNETHIVRAKDLAHYMTSGEVNLMLAKNALSIARDVGLPTVLEEGMVSEEAVSNIDMLVSLYAIQYMKSSHLQTLQKLFKQEGARTDGNGLAALMKYHQAIEQEAKDTLFEGNSVSIIKGYTPEITNPHREIKIVTLASDAKHLEAMGYQLHSILSADPNDVNQAKRMVYFTEEPSTQRFVTGAMSLTADSSKGTSIIDGSSLSVKDKISALKSITTRSATKLKAKSAKDYDPTNIKNRGIAPTYSNLGSIQDFRYEMTHATRDSLLQRNNNFAEIMGTYAGSNFDKASTPKHNETVIDALYKDYKENYLKDPRAYVQIGKDATDPKAVEMYAMLPYKTRKYIDKVWGKREPMWVRNDALLATFGTNKYSIGEAFEKNPDARNVVEKTIVDMFKVLFGDTAKLRALQGERLNQELVSWFKSTIVIRNLTTLMGNQSFNVGMLLVMGVSPVDIIKDSVTAFKAGNRFRKDNTELVRVENNMKANVGNFEDNVQLQARLKDSIARNPLKQFLDAGMLNTIVEDVSLDVEDYNYKSKLAQQLDDQLDKLNPTVRKIGANLVVAPSTELYQVLANATQLSDFTAKYTLYKHMTSKAKDRLSHEDALAMADRMFINYDVPTSKELQYGNDMGLWMFTKYTLRTQRAIAYLLKERKASLLAQGMLGTALGMPLATAPAFFNVIGNPFHPGALMVPGALTQPLPIKLLSGGF